MNKINELVSVEERGSTGDLRDRGRKTGTYEADLTDSQIHDKVCGMKGPGYLI